MGLRVCIRGLSRCIEFGEGIGEDAQRWRYNGFGQAGYWDQEGRGMRILKAC